MSAKSKNLKSREEPRWLDSSENVRKIILGFYGLCTLIIVVDLIFSLGWHKHAAFAEEKPFYSLETLPAFYGIFGFGAGLAVVYFSKIIRSWNGKKVLMRPEDYWEKK